MLKGVKKARDCVHVGLTSGLREATLWARSKAQWRGQEQGRGGSNKGEGIHPDRTSSGRLPTLLLGFGKLR